VLSALFYSQAPLLPSRKFKRDHVCAICDDCHGCAANIAKLPELITGFGLSVK
jgi:hypothetical protein